MRLFDATVFCRWTVVATLIISPLVLGCGSKPGAEPEAAQSPGGESPGSESPGSESPGSESSPDETTSADTQNGIPSEKPSGNAPPGSDPFAAVVPSADATTASDKAAAVEPEAEPPKSFFRSLGRALQRGVTDAAGSSGDTAASVPDDTAPTGDDPPAAP